MRKVLAGRALFFSSRGAPQLRRPPATLRERGYFSSRRVREPDDDARRRPQHERGGRRAMTRVAMGGTFDVLHRGHRALLDAAFAAGDQGVSVGVTTDAFANAHRQRTVRPYAE